MKTDSGDSGFAKLSILNPITGKWELVGEMVVPKDTKPSPELMEKFINQLVGTGQLFGDHVASIEVVSQSLEPASEKFSESKEVDELGTKLSAELVLSDRSERVKPHTEEELRGVYLLERDDELYRKETHARTIQERDRTESQVQKDKKD